MIFETNKKKVDGALEIASMHGFSRIINYFENQEIEILKDLHRKVFKTHEKKYENQIVELNKKQLKDFDLISNHIKQINDRINHFFKKKFFLNKVWFENKIFDVNTDENYRNKLPYIPHIDKKRFFKIMIYLDKTDENNGAIKFCKKNPNELEQFRQKILKNEELSNVIQNDNLNFFSISGDEGDLIFFDTNCPHKAGIGRKNNSRRVIRIDFETMDWNCKNLFSKTKLVLKDILL